MKLLRGLCIIISLCILWQIIIWLFKLPPYILPSPWLVAKTLYAQADVIADQSIPTIVEILLGLLFGILIGMFSALILAIFQPLRAWLMPVLLISQAIPTFAIAPLLVVWFGYGIASKVMTTVIMLFFPITTAFFDGLRRTHPGWLDLAKTMNASTWQSFWHIRIPAALPSLASGLRVAAAIAPIGAIIAEWVGSSHGLGYLMLNANARMQIDMMFAVLVVITVLTLLLYTAMDKALKYFIYWDP